MSDCAVSDRNTGLISGRVCPCAHQVPQWWNKSFAERLEALSAKMLRSVKAVKQSMAPRE